jgi:hypothetical protein
MADIHELLVNIKFYFRLGETFVEANKMMKNILKRVITGNESWVYGYDVEMQMQSSKWLGKNSPRPKKARWIRSNVKVILTVSF